MKISQELIQQAKHIDLPRFLESRGFDFRQNGTNSYTSKAHDSLVISLGKNGFWVYFWNSRKGQSDDSGDSIKFMQTYFGLDFRGAVSELTNTTLTEEFTTKKEHGSHQCSPEKNICSALEYPKIDENMHRVFAYLTKTRLLDPSIPQFFAKNKLLQQDTRGNIVCPWINQDGEIVGAELHGTISYDGYRFKGIPKGATDFTCGFNFDKGTPTKIYFFESVIDLLSFLEIHEGQPLLEASRFVSMAGKRQEIINYYKDHFKGLELILGLDNSDDVDLFIEKHNYTNLRRLFPENGKDWNDQLKNMKNA